MLDDLVQDGKSALRQIATRPLAATLIVITLALGIGANTAMFSLVQTALVSPAPVPDPDSLVALWTTCRRGDPRCGSSYPDMLDYRRRASTLRDLAAYAKEVASLGDERGAQVVNVHLATGNYFPLLGLKPAAGRLLDPGDDMPGSTAVAVLSHDLWSGRFGSDPRVVGRTVRLNGHAHTVLGVTPRGFRGLEVGAGPDIYVPLLAGPGLQGGDRLQEAWFAERDTRWIDQLIGRRAPGATIEQVRAEMAGVSEQMASEDPEARGPRMITVDLADRLIRPRGSEAGFSRFLLLMLAVVGLTLLLACANLANLQLAQSSRRRQEMAIRAAIGAGRGRLLRQALTESLVLSLLGGLAGLLLGPALIRVLSGYELPGGVDIAGLRAGIDLPVLLFAFVLSLVAGVLFGLAPGLRHGRRRASRVLAVEMRDASGGAAWTRGLLVAVQVAVSLVLLAGAALFARALQTGLSVDLGFDGGDRLTLATIDLSLLQYGAGDAEALLAGVQERMLGNPAVTAFAAGTRVPLMAGGAATFLDSVLDYQPAADEELRLEFNRVTPGFFRALGLPLRAGRTFAPADAVEDGAIPLVVNQEMADRWWPGREAVGGRVVFGGERAGRVLGVVADTKWDDGMLTPDYPFAYMPLSGSSAARGPVTLLVRSDHPGGIAPALRQALTEIDADVPVLSMTSFRELRQTVLMPQRIGATLLGGFAALALLLSAVGIYGVVGHAVGQRASEIGIRIALGADRGKIERLMVATVLGPVVAGVAVGVLAIVLLSGTVRAFLYGVDPVDPLALGGGVAVLVAAALGAAWMPARRAAALDPVRTLTRK